VLAACVLAFCVLQRRGMFGRVLRMAAKLFGATGGAGPRADAVDHAIREMYRDRRKVAPASR
jgi:hypothetical protein